MSTTTIELSSPIDIDGATVKTLTMREPTVGDQIAASEVKGNESKQEVALIANLCELTPADIHKISLRDYREVQEAYSDFID